MDVSKQHWINMELTKNVSFRILVPLSIPSEIGDVRDLPTRDWVVPGEKLILFVEMSRFISNLDEFSFYCAITDTDSSPQYKRNPNFIPLSSISTKQHLPGNLGTLKMKDGRTYFPSRIQVPNSRTNKFQISAFCLRNPDPVASFECYALQPFTVCWDRYLTPQSVIVQLSVLFHFPNDEKWKDKSIEISATNLKFSESAEDEPLYTSSIAIIKTSESSFNLSNGDSASIVFVLKPLSDDGAIRVAKMPLTFTISWTAPIVTEVKESKYQIDYVSTFPFNVGCQQADLVISAPMIKCELLKPSSIPLRITNMPSTGSNSSQPRTVDICFGSGKIQPMTKRQEIQFSGGYETKSIEFGFIPLCVGEHKLKIWAEIGKDIIYPMFPIFLSVDNPQSEK